MKPKNNLYLTEYLADERYIQTLLIEISKLKVKLHKAEKMIEMKDRENMELFRDLRITRDKLEAKRYSV